MAAGYTCETTPKYTSCNSGYYMSNCGTNSANWTGQTVTPTTGNTCNLCPNGYTCSGGTRCPVVAGIKCAAGTYIKANTTTCTSCPGGSYCPGVTTTSTASSTSDRGITKCPAGSYCPANSSAPTACPSGYGNSAAGSVASSACYTVCTPGTAVWTPGQTCKTPAGTWYTPGEHTVSYGQISPVSYCPYGSNSNAAVNVGHDAANDCMVTVPGGYESLSSLGRAARYIRISSVSGAFPLAGIMAKASGSSITLTAASGMTNPSYAVDPSLATQAVISNTIPNVGIGAIFDMGTVYFLTDIQFAMGNLNGDGRNIKIEVSPNNSTWTTVFEQNITGPATLPGALYTVPVVTRTNTLCAAGTYHGQTTIAAGASVTCTACPTAADHKMTSYNNLTHAAYVYPDENLTLRSVSLTNWESAKGGTTIESCRANYGYANSRGVFTIESVKYNPSTGKYDKDGDLYYTHPYAGYYLTTRYSDTYCDTSGRNMLYRDAQLCPAGSYCKGRTGVTSCSSGTYADSLGIDGSVGVGYFSTGGAKVQNPTNTDCVGTGKTCGPLAPGYFSVQAGMKDATPTYMSQDCGLATIDGVSQQHACGQVDAGYYSTGGGTHPRPTASGNGCIAGKRCGMIAPGYYGNPGATSETGAGAVDPGYYSTGGATSSAPESAECVGDNTCGRLHGGYFSTGGATTASPSASDCVGYIGSQIWNGANSPHANVCGKVMPGYYSAGGGVMPCPGNLGTSCNEALGFSTTMLNNSVDIVKTGCVGGNCGQIVAGFYSNGGGTSATPSSAGDGCVAGQSCGICAPGSYSGAGAGSCNSCPALGGSNWSWNMDAGATSWSQCSRAATPDGCSAGKVYVNAASAGSWEPLESAKPFSWATSSSLLVAKPGYYRTSSTAVVCTICPAGTYSTGGTVASCTPLAAGYYSHVEGMTTATPVNGTDCSGSYTETSMPNSTFENCGKIAAGHYSTGGGISAIGASCVDGKECGNIAAGYYSTGGGTSATPTAAGNGCLAGQQCGVVGAGYYSTGAGMSADGTCNSKLMFACGTIAAGYWSYGGAKTETPASASDCVNGNCGLIHIGFYSTGGGKTPRPYPSVASACLDGFECGYVAAGYYSNGGGTSATPKQFLEGCVGQWNNNGTMTNHICGKVNAGYFSTGGAITPTPTAQDCHGHDETDETAVDANRCGSIDAGYYGAAGATKSTGSGMVNAGHWNNGCGTNATGGVCSSSYAGGKVNAGYYNMGGGTSATPIVRGEGCVNVSTTQCGTVAPGYWGAAGATQYGGSGAVAPGYYSTGGATSRTPGASDCAGKVAIIENGKLMGASDVDNTCGQVVAGYWNNACGINATGGVCSSSYNGGEIIAGYWGEAGAVSEKGSGYLAPGYYSTGGATSEYPESNECVGDNTCGAVAPGYWNNGGGTSATGTCIDIRACGAVNAGYYATGGGTSAAPTAAGNGCLANKECGPVNAGYYATGGATSAQGHGIIKLGLYSTCGATSEGGSSLASSDYLECVDGCECGRVAPGYFATGGGTSATPTAAGNGCLSGQSCGTMAAGYYSRGGAGTATATAYYCWGYNTYSDGVNGCGQVGAGYWNNGGGTDVNGTCVSGKSCGLIAAGYYGAVGATSSTGSGTVSGGYYSTGGGTSATPTANGNGCVGTNNKCGKLSAQYYSNGGSTADGATCISGKTCGTCDTNYRANTATGKTAATQCQISCGAGMAVLEKNKACAILSGGKYKTGTALVNYGSTSPTATDITSGWAVSTVYSCPSSYSISGTTATNHDARTDCSITCGAGTQVASTNATCTTPGGTTWYTGSHSVAAGSTSGNNVKACKTNYATANTTTATDHDSVADCKTSCAAGYYVPTAGAGCQVCAAGKYCEAKSGIAQDAISAVTGNVTAGYFASGGGTTATGECLDGYSCGSCSTGTGANGRLLYSDAGAASCSECPAVTGALASRVTGYSGWWSNNIHNRVGGCYANFADSDDTATYKTMCYYNATDGTYGGANSSCQVYAPTACSGGYYSVIKQATEWTTGNYAACKGVDCMKGKVCGLTDAGSYSPDGATTQTECAIGSYTSTTGQSECVACAAGKTNSATGSTSCATTCGNATGVASTGWETPVWNSNNTITNLCTIKATAGCSANYYKNSNACAACPSDTYPNSAAGATAQTQCYANVTLDKNGFSGSIAAGAGTGCKVATAATGTNNATLQVFYDTECTLPTISGFTQTGYTAASGWASANTIGATAVTKIAAAKTKPATTYFARKTTCAADYYKNNTTTCSTCASGTNSKYTKSDAGNASDVNVCYLNPTAKNYVAEVGKGLVACAAGGYCPGSTTTKIYYGGTASDTHLTTGGRTQCPAGYRDGTTGYSLQSQCTMNVMGGKYVAKANESSASGTCALGYAKPAHTVTYGETSSCSACTGATYADQEGMSACTECPTVSGASSYSYWNTSSEAGNHTVRAGCNAIFPNPTLDDGVLTSYACYIDSGADTYGVEGTGKGCWVNKSALKCNAGYYNKKFNDTPSATQDIISKYATELIANICRPVEEAYWSPADSLTRTACETGLVTCGAGLCANEAGDCGRKLHAGDNVIYLRSEKRTTPSLNVKVGDKVFYGNLGDVIANSLRVKNGTKNYSVVNDNQ